MLKSEIITKLNKKLKNLSSNDTEKIINLFFDKISSGLNQNNNVEIRGFGSLKKKINKAKFVRNQKTNEKDPQRTPKAPQGYPRTPQGYLKVPPESHQKPL